MPIGDLLASITGEPSPTQPSIRIPPPKRKSPDAAYGRTADKAPRPDANNSRLNTPSAGPPKHGQNGRSVTATFKNGQPTPPPTDGPAKAPKKGSFAEIMARGKAVQATRAPQVGKIQHKRIEKLPSKKEREEMKAQKGTHLQKNLGPGGKFAAKHGAMLGKAEDKKANGKSAPPEPEKKVKKAALATTGYSGTARPRPGASKPGAQRPPASSSRYERDRLSSKLYTYASEEEDDMEEQEDYESDASSDMEAAAFEVDEEEEFAARAARKEDAEALMEENRLKREKAEKKRRLEAMAAKRR